MKIVYVVPGFGGTFYCENCMRDDVLLGQLRKLGHDVQIVPMYLPLSEEQFPNYQTPIFYGAVNVYLREMSGLFRHSPAWMERLFDSRKLLHWASGKSGSTDARGLEKMTLSVLQGMEGNQARALQELTDWLEREARPDIVHLSNALLLGLAREIRKRLEIPVVCSLQDEDSWMESMDQQCARRIWAEMCARQTDIDAFMPVSDWFGELMRNKMCIPQEKLHTVPVGIDTSGYIAAEPDPEHPVIGYLSRFHKGLGLDILVDAFLILREDPLFRNLRLRATGGMTGADRKFVKKLQKKLGKADALESAELEPDLFRNDPAAFFRDLSVLSVPIIQGEAFGTFQIEAMASGVPVVQPDAGAFPEIIRETGGGLIYRHESAASLAGALSEVLSDQQLHNKLSLAGRKAACEKFDISVMAARMAAVYDRLKNQER